jgi:hypothetical protein
VCSGLGVMMGEWGGDGVRDALVVEVWLSRIVDHVHAAGWQGEGGVAAMLADKGSVVAWLVRVVMRVRVSKRTSGSAAPPP